MPSLKDLLCKVLIVSFFFHFQAGCSSEKKPPSSAAPPKVTVAHPVQKTVTDYIEVPGNLQPFQQVSLVARVVGYLQSINFKDGSFVKKGQLLFVIEPEPYQQDLRQAEATAAQDEATLKRAKQEYARQLKMYKQNATSESTVQQWQAASKTAEATLKADNAKTELARINLGYTRVSAPFDGRMERHLIDIGNLVGTSGSTTLSSIHRLNPIYAYFNLSEHQVLQLIRLLRKRKAPYETEKIPVFLGVRGEEGYPHEGELDYASTVLEQTTGTLELRGIFPNPMVNEVPELLPGMYARVRIPIAHKPALLVPEAALQIIQGKYYLLLVNKQNTVEQRFVTVGEKVDDMRVIEKGIESSDWVIVSGLQHAHPGSKVTPVTEEGKDPPQAKDPVEMLLTTSDGQSGSRS